MLLRISVIKSRLLPLLMAALAGFSVPSYAYDWQKVAPKNGGFSADFPGTPKFLTGHVKDIVEYIWRYGDQQQDYMAIAATVDYYVSDLGGVKSLRQEEKGFLGTQGKETSYRQVQVQGANGNMLPASVFDFTLDGGWEGISRTALDGDTMYMTVVMWKKGFDASAIRKRFMASYKLLPRTKPPEPDEAKK